MNVFFVCLFIFNHFFFYKYCIFFSQREGAKIHILFTLEQTDWILFYLHFFLSFRIDHSVVIIHN